MSHSRVRSAAVGLFAFIAVAAPGSAQGINSTKFHSDMRKLWEDHVSWTRLYLVSAAADLPDKSATTERLLRNQTDIGNAIVPFYGDAAGARLTTLLRQHILIAAELIDAAKAGDDTKKADANKRWFANADELAGFLSTANPGQWRLAEMKDMLREHLTLTTAEVVAHLTKNWPADIAAYDKVHDQILTMADGLSSGIMRQFPTKFSPQTVSARPQ